jgi:hypothetical protein
MSRTFCATLDALYFFLPIYKPEMPLFCQRNTGRSLLENRNTRRVLHQLSWVRCDWGTEAPEREFASLVVHLAWMFFASVASCQADQRHDFPTFVDDPPSAAQASEAALLLFFR